MTHGDIVRQMTNEELAKMITAAKHEIIKRVAEILNMKEEDVSQLKHSIYCIMLEYLNREVEENTVSD